MNIYARFATLHESGYFVMPNPWDPGSLTLLVRARARAMPASISPTSPVRRARSRVMP